MLSANSKGKRNKVQCTRVRLICQAGDYIHMGIYTRMCAAVLVKNQKEMFFIYLCNHMTTILMCLLSWNKYFFEKVDKWIEKRRSE